MSYEAWGEPEEPPRCTCGHPDEDHDERGCQGEDCDCKEYTPGDEDSGDIDWL